MARIFRMLFLKYEDNRRRQQGYDGRNPHNDPGLCLIHAKVITKSRPFADQPEEDEQERRDKSHDPLGNVFQCHSAGGQADAVGNQQGRRGAYKNAGRTVRIESWEGESG